MKFLPKKGQTTQSANHSIHLRTLKAICNIATNLLSAYVTVGHFLRQIQCVATVRETFLQLFFNG
jgi:hypothetical protein